MCDLKIVISNFHFYAITELFISKIPFQFNFTHLHKYETTNDPNRKIAITTGEYAVTELIGNDYTRKHV